MKKTIRILTVAMVLCFGTILTSSATMNAVDTRPPDRGVWVTINSTYEDGAWHILQECKASLNVGCKRGTFQEVIVKSKDAIAL